MPIRFDQHVSHEGAAEVPLQPFHFQKARLLLPVTVKSDTGLSEGEIWFLDSAEITIWCVESLRPGKRYEMRADVKTLGRNVDLVARIEQAMAGRDAGVPTGFLHLGGFETVSEGDRQRLLQRFWQLNPEHAPPEDPPPRRDVQRVGEARVESDVKPSAAEGQRSPREEPRGAPRAQPRAAGAPARRTRPKPRRVAKEAEAIPAAPLPRADRPTPALAPGAPPSVLVRYAHREVMQADAVLREGVLWLYTGRHPLLWEGQQVKLLLQVPTGAVLDIACVVAAERPDGTVLVARHLHASLVANLRAALGC